ncbi:phage protein [Salmonella enterica]|nr:phage protein [Salmonella enterica]
MLLTMEEIKAQLRLDEDFDADDRICNCWPVRHKSGRKRI